MSKLLEDIAEKFDLPAETVAGLPSVSLTGDSRVLIENHRGILEYTEKTVEAAGGRLRIRINGEKLVLRAMDSQSLLITGKIFGVELE